MQKNSFQDVIPPSGKRSIRNVPIPEKRGNKIDELLEETADFRLQEKRLVHQHLHPDEPGEDETPLHTRHSHQHQAEEEFEPETINEEQKVSFKTTSRRIPPTQPSGKKGLLLGGIIGGVVLLGILFVFLFQKAEVAISLKKEIIPIDVVATSTAETAEASSLPYRVIAVKKENATEVAATGPLTKVEKKASGTIIVYNNHSSESQQLVATTRFETPAGLVYRIDKPITVPGTKVVNGETVPGSVEAVVYADQPGANYNIDKTDFKIPGFKGDPKYDNFYARSKTPLSGGFSGNVSEISESDLANINKNLEESLKTEAMNQLQADKPADYVLLSDGGVRGSYTSTLAPASDGKTKVMGTYSAEAIVFKKTDLENLIANGSSVRYHFSNLESLKLDIQDNDESFISNPSLAVRITGSLTTGESFDTSALQSALAGKSKHQLQEILKMYPEIIKAEAVLHPFWKSSFPEDAKKIKITVTN